MKSSQTGLLHTKSVLARPRKRPPIKPLPSIERLREAFDFDADSGVLRWRRRLDVGSGKQFNKVFAGKPAGKPDSSGHIQLTLDGQLYYAHRIIWKLTYGRDPEGQIDHRGGDKMDNRADGLRDATHAENMQNRAIFKNNTSGFKGVSWHAKARKWQAMICVGGRNRRLGLHHTPEAAHAAYVAAAEGLHGAFAHAG